MARSLPTGTVTFLFTDIEGSTRLAALLGEAYADLLEQHRALIRDATSMHHGIEVGAEGDALFVAFERVTDALAAAVEGQLKLRRHTWPPSSEIRVRMGVHTGEAQVVGDDYVGVSVHEANRIASAAHGGQVLLSKLSRDLAGAGLPENTTLRSLGLFRLKDIAGFQEIFQVDHPDLVRDFPPLRTRASVPSNLPAQLTSFVGRSRERAEVAAAVTPGRLVTLLGPGGVGKTRLAVETAGAVRDKYADGVWLVDLSSLAEPNLVPSVVASALGVRAEAQSDDEHLLRYLEERSVLIVLDNCEHLIAACADITGRILSSVSGVSVLATSREPIGLPGEITYPVLPMELEDEGSESDAVRLFVDRVRLVNPSYVLTDEDKTAVAEICRRLDGLPLAIELAAANMRMLAPAEIAERLSDRFAFLQRGPRTVSERQQTLRSTLDWGYELLSQPERVLLTRLSIFSGGFSLDAVEGVCGGDGLDASAVYELLSSLVDKSLVMRSIRGGRTRYFLLETIREYGLTKLADFVPAQQPVAAPSVEDSALFLREGEVWAVGTPSAPIRLRDSKGLRYLAVLLHRPGEDIAVLDLIEATGGADPGSRQTREAIGDAGEALDAQAVRAYRRRLEEIASELEDARAFGDEGRAALLEDESARVSHELAAGLGLGGRHRKAGSTLERARLSVTKAIRSAILRIAQSAPDLGRHLESSVRTGVRCGYFPDDGAPSWRLD